jgi:outer membrane protein OmpA-like peptidoglycan-associated protein
MKRLQFFFAFLLVSFAAISQKTETISVYFDLDNRVDFSKTELKAGLNKVKPSKVEIMGYADFLGSNEYNNQLSTDRAKAVSKYITSNWDESISITKTEGKGELPSNGGETESGDQKSRRVDVIMITPKPKVNLVAAPRQEVDIDLPIPVEPKTLDIDTSTAANIVLEGVEFIPGRHYPLPESREKLEQLSLTMKKYAMLKIEIQGFICCDYTQFDGMDNDTETMNLSENRAQFIYDFLIRERIDADRLSYKGYGSSKPKVFPEVTEEDRQANRRVEIRIIK